MNLPGASVKNRAAELHFVLQSAESLELYFLKGNDEALLENYSFSRIVEIQGDEILSLAIAPFDVPSNFKVLFVGSKEEADDYKENAPPRTAVTPPAGFVSLALFEEEQQKKNETIADLMDQLKRHDGRIAALERKGLKRKNTSYVPKTENSIGDLEVVMHGEVSKLGAHVVNTEKIFKYLEETQGKYFEITQKYQLKIRSKLKHLRIVVQTNLNHPDRCGYAVMLELLPLEVFCETFMPADKHQRKVRKGQTRQKVVLNTSVQQLFRAILLFCGARVFAPLSMTSFYQQACDGVNHRVDQFNCRKAQRHSMAAAEPPVWTTLADCDQWHKKMAPKLPSTVDDSASSDEAIEDTDRLDVHQFDQNY